LRVQSSPAGPAVRRAPVWSGLSARQVRAEPRVKPALARTSQPELAQVQ
jgi:hypothetical protein